MELNGVNPCGSPDYTVSQTDSPSAVFEKINNNKVYDIAGYSRANISLEKKPNGDYTLTLYSEIPMDSQDYSEHVLTLKEWQPHRLSSVNRYNPDMTDTRSAEEKLKTFYTDIFNALKTATIEGNRIRIYGIDKYLIKY